MQHEEIKGQDLISTEKTDLHGLVSTFNDVQHLRIIMGGRMRTTTNKAPQYQLYIKQLEGLETAINNDINSEVRKYPIHNWIINQRGLSYGLAGQLVGVIRDINRFPDISNHQ